MVKLSIAVNPPLIIPSRRTGGLSKTSTFFLCGHFTFVEDWSLRVSDMLTCWRGSKKGIANWNSHVFDFKQSPIYSSAKLRIRALCALLINNRLRSAVVDNWLHRTTMFRYAQLRSLLSNFHADCVVSDSQIEAFSAEPFSLNRVMRVREKEQQFAFAKSVQTTNGKLCEAKSRWIIVQSKL